MRTRQVILTAAILVLAGGRLYGPDVVLLNRQHYTGEVRVNPDTVFVKVDKTTYTIPRGSVREVRLWGAEVAQYESRKATLADTADAHAAFAQWLDSKLQNAEAWAHWERALELDPESKAAREALGFKLVGGKWTRSEEDRWRIRANWLGREGADACVELAKIYRAAGDDRRVEIFLRRALIANTAHREALVMMRPITDRYVSKNKYRLPVPGTWAVINDHNEHHRSAAFMQYGYDFQKVDENFRTARVGEPKGVEDYYTWDAPIVAAADGEVYSLNDGYADAPLGASGDFWSANTVCLKHAGGEYTVYGHLKNGSICVRKGQKVKAGDVVGRGGNSGSAWCPHMHWAMYDRDGIGLPPTFVDFVEVTRTGEQKIESGRISENHVYRNTAEAK